MKPCYHYCGLYWLRPKCVHHYVWYNLVALIRSDVNCTLIDQMTQVDIVQEYINNESIPIEASYMFPLDEKAAVCGFEAEIAGKTIVGKAKEKHQAKREYDQAVARGDGAFLLEEKKADIFKMKVGNLLPGERVKIKITYVAEMKSELTDLKKRFLLPTTIAPRYTPPHDWREGESDRNFEPLSGAGKGYEMSINMSLHMMSDIVAIDCPTHSVSHQIHGKTASVGLSLGTEVMTKDFIVNVEVSKPHEPRVCLELNENGDLAAMVTLFPHFQFRDVPAEIVFVVDRSGSMGGSRIQHAREAMQLFMRSLPEDCYFNIVGFGSRHQKLYPSSKKYDDQTLREATTHISGMDANLGGTELVAPLTAVFNSPPIRGYPRQVFVLTDGQVSNTERVIQLVEAHHRTNRVFSLGLGRDVSHNLVEGIARAGKGTAQFVVDGSDMAAKVMKQLKEAIQPALENVKVDWGGKVEGSSSSSSSAPAQPQGAIVMSLLGYASPDASAPPEPKVEVHQAPHRVPPIFDSQHFLIYAMYSENKPPSTVKITAQSPDGPLTVELPVDPAKAIRGKLIHTLAARAMIRDLEEGRSWMTALGYDVKSARVKEEIVRLGTKYQLASLHTSFIAIEERTGTHYDCYLDPYFEEEPVRHVYHAAGAGAGARRRKGKKKDKKKQCFDSADYYMSAAAPPREARAPAPSGGFACKSVAAPAPQASRFSSCAAPCAPAPCAPAPCAPAPCAPAPALDSLSSNLEDQCNFGEVYSSDEEEDDDEVFLVKEKEEKCKKESSSRQQEEKMMKEKEYAKKKQEQQKVKELMGKGKKPSVASIAMEQSVNGSFSLTDAIAKIVSLDRSTLQAIYANFNISKILSGDVGDRVVATAAVIAFVEKNYPSEKDVWERFIGKARTFLEKNVNGKGGESGDELVKGISALL